MIYKSTSYFIFKILIWFKTHSFKYLIIGCVITKNYLIESCDFYLVCSYLFKYFSNISLIDVLFSKLQVMGQYWCL